MTTWLFTSMDSDRRERLISQISEGKLKAWLEVGGGDPYFGAWMYLVDLVLHREVGITHGDLADFCWRDEYAAGTSPRDAARDALAGDDIGWLLGL